MVWVELSIMQPTRHKILRLMGIMKTWLQHEVQAGETLYSIWRKFELPGAELSRLIAIEGPDRPLTRLQSGKSVFILVDTGRRIQRVEIRSFGQANYRYDRQGEGFALKE